MPPRYLVAYIGRLVSARRALLRFPPGVTLEDVGYDWRSSVLAIDTPTLPDPAVERLRRLGVEVMSGPRAVSKALWRAPDESLETDPGAFVEDYLGVNARLGGERCVTIVEYAMNTWIGGDLLSRVLRDSLRRTGGVRMYGDAAFRESQLPDVLRLRVWGVADGELSMTVVGAPCGLHGDMCRGYSDRWRDPGEAIKSFVPRRHLGVRVALPRQLLDELAAARGSGGARMFARAALPVVRRVLDALPTGAKKDARFRYSMACLVAMAAARTCEEHAMLAETLRRCRSLREMERRASNVSWAVSRALENLRDRR